MRRNVTPDHDYKYDDDDDEYYYFIIYFYSTAMFVVVGGGVCSSSSLRARIRRNSYARVIAENPRENVYIFVFIILFYCYIFI